jgi:hypothetical protein
MRSVAMMKKGLCEQGEIPMGAEHDEHKHGQRFFEKGRAR